jgi:uracil-DNA glycosylase family 4
VNDLPEIDRGYEYRALVDARKRCRLCKQLENPSECAGGIYDSEEIGPWSQWQGNLNAELLIVGQDWGDTRYFIRSSGYEPKTSRTNSTLMTLLAAVGIRIDEPSKRLGRGAAVFLTNAVLCLKTGGAQAKVDASWFANCGSRFLRPTIDLIAPRVVVSLGQWAYRGISAAYSLKKMTFNAAVEKRDGFTFQGRTKYFPMYHCGARILNTHRSMKEQLHDWERVREALERV